ncbi:MAG: hypothetical protein WD844_10025 [Thermoleophilaceae bacterium]
MGAGFVPPDLEAVTRAFLSARARFVVIGGFAVVANRHVRATRDVDLLIPGDADNDASCVAALQALGGVRDHDSRPVTAEMLVGQPHLRAHTEAGLVDIVREGRPPLDFATVWDRALISDLGHGEFRLAGLASIVAFKRLAGRPQDRNDLLALEAEHGPLPIEPIPGLDC